MSVRSASPFDGIIPAHRPRPAPFMDRVRVMSTVDARQAPTGTFAPPSRPKAPRPMWMIELGQSAKRVRALGPGWDGPRSGVVSDDTIQRAVALVSAALWGLDDARAPYLMPAGDGSLQIEWDRKHAKLEFCLEPDGSLDFWSRDLGTGREREGGGAEALALFRRWARWAAQGSSDAAHAVAQEDVAVFELAA